MSSFLPEWDERLGQVKGFDPSPKLVQLKYIKVEACRYCRKILPVSYRHRCKGKVNAEGDVASSSEELP